MSGLGPVIRISVGGAEAFFCGCQSFPGESNEQPESRSTDVAKLSSHPQDHQGGLVKCMAGPAPRVPDLVGINPENFHL